MRNLEIRRTILDVLEVAFPYATPETTLRVQLDTRLRPPVGDAEFEQAMTFLNTKAHVKTVADPIDEQNVKWTITETGKVLLRQ